MSNKLKYLKEFNQFELIMEASDKDTIVGKLRKIANKINILPAQKRKRFIVAVVTSLLSVMYAQDALDVLKKLNDKDFLSVFFDTQKEKENKKIKSPFKDIDSLSLSSKGIEFIKNEEKLRLAAYDLKDGHITIGWGHAERYADSEYKVGDRITEKEAMRLLKQDLAIAEKGVKRNIKSWSKDIKLTQDQFDVLVSLAYNKGVSGLFNSSFIEDLKANNWIAAAKKIRSNFKPGRFMKGHSKRRRKEANLFLSFLKYENELKKQKEQNAGFY